MNTSLRQIAIVTAILSALLGIASCGSGTKNEQTPHDESMERLRAAEVSLAALFRTLTENRSDLPLEYADTFKMRLLRLLDDPASFRHPFDSLADAGVRIVDSDDDRVRIFWWLHPWSGTFRNFPAIAQYRDRQARLRVVDLDPEREDGYAATAYMSLHHLTGATYLAIGVGQIWQGGNFETIEPMTFSDAGVSESDVGFQIGDSTYASIWLDKNWYFNHMDRFGNTIPLISAYDSAARVLTFPEIVDIADGSFYNDVLAEESIQPSGDTIRLRFNGRYFEPADGK